MAKILGFKHKLSYYLNLIDTREESGDLWGVLDACRNAKNLATCKIKKQSFDVLIGNTYYKMDEHLLACESFFKAVWVNELRCACLFGIGRSLCCLNLFDLGLDYFETALKWDYDGKFAEDILWWTDYVLTKINSKETANARILEYGKALISQKRYKDAITCLYQITNYSEKAQNFYALALFLDGEIDVAERQNAANLRHKDNIFAMCLQYDIFKAKSNTLEQNKMLDKIINAQSLDADYLLNKALFLSKNELYSQSLAVLEQCLKIKKYSPKLHLFCAQVNYNLGKVEEALYNVSRAKWIDFDNPIYMFYFDLFKKGELRKPVKITQKFDKEHGRAKIDELKTRLLEPHFSIFLFKNHFLLENLTYGFIENDSICDMASSILANAKNTEAKRLFGDLLFSVKPNLYKKFLMLRHAFYSEKFNKIKLVCNLKILEIKTKKSQYIGFAGPIKAAVCNAFAYAFCHFLGREYIDNIIKNARQVINKQIFLSLSENELSALLLCNNPVVFKSVCQFFSVDEIKVSLFKNLLFFSNLENYEKQN